MSSNYTSHNIKKIISNIESSRVSISSKKNIPSNLTSLKQTFSQLDASLKGQAVYIRDLDPSGSIPSHQAHKPSEEKKQMAKIIEIVHQEIIEYIEVCKEGLGIGLKDKKDFGGWDKVLTDLSKRMESLKANIVPANVVETILQLLNLKDNLMRQILKGMIYWKHLLWLDLKIPYQSYVHNQIQSILDIIKSSPQKYGYVPTKLQYSQISSLSEGRWNLSNQKSETSVASFLGIVVKDFQEVLETTKNYSSLNQTSETFEDINKNQVIVKGLRQKIEQHSINYNVLLDKYRSVQAKDSDWELKSKLDMAQSQNIKKDHEVNLLHTTISSLESTVQGFKDKQKQLEEEILKLNNSYYPKLKEVEGFQKGLLEEFFKIRKEVEVISVSLENDNELKKRMQNEIKDQKELVNSLVDILGRERRRIQEMKQENKKLDELVLELTSKHFAH